MKDPALHPLSEIIHEIDLRDGIYSRPETEGIAQVLKGLVLTSPTDGELESRGIALFEGLHAAFGRSLGK